MLNVIYSLFGSGISDAPWDSTAPIREELFGMERLEQHAVSLASDQTVSDPKRPVAPLQARLKQNAAVLLSAYQASAKELESGCTVVPAAEWLLDNYHLVEEQIREVKDDLPAGFYRQLPKLDKGPFAGYPRVFGLAWAFVAHTDSRFDADNLYNFVTAYQSVTPLTIGELWAIAITLRIVLIENLRRLVDQITQGRIDRADADQLIDKLLASGSAQSVLLYDIETRSSGPLSEVFAAQLAKRLRDQDPKTTPALEWLEQRLHAQDLNVEQVVSLSQHREGASNVSIRNVITSMRLISDIDWTLQFEGVSLVDAKLRSHSGFEDMDFRTRNLYRTEIETLARGSAFCELEVTGLVLKAASKGAKNNEDTVENLRLGDPGYYLLDKGRDSFEKSIAFRPSFGLMVSRLHLLVGLKGYINSILLLALTLVIGLLFLFKFTALPAYTLLIIGLIGFIPATEISTAIVNRSVTWRLKNRFLPGLELTSGVPQTMRTLIAVPTLLTNEKDLCEQVERLEVHYLGGIAGDLTFSLLVDGLDANEEVLTSDGPLLAMLTAKIDQLNQRYGPGPAGKRFLLLYRRRQFNLGENKWMAWERKRGKLHELNRLLRGATDTSFIALAGNPLEVPQNVRYVITLDADTRLPRDTALRLIGKMGHPLNRPRFNAHTQRIEAGYGIIQPRVTPSLPTGIDGSFYQRVISSPGGMDPYAAATSDVYQDLFGEGSFTGKGIYDVDAFEAALAGRVKDNTMLSHDLFEGIFARAALVSDLEVVEEFPARYDAVAKRQHRWTRGDWQLLPWILGRFSGASAVSWLGRWKLLDNLRRSLVAPITLCALVLCWLLPLPLATISTGLVLATIFVPVFTPCIFSFMPRKPSFNIRSHVRAWLNDLRLAAVQLFFSIAFLPDQSWRALDAVGRTLIRLFVTHRRLLEWTSSAQSNSMPRLNGAGFYKTMWPSTLLSLVIGLFMLTYSSNAWPLILPFTLLWLSAPALAFWSSRARSQASQHELEKYDTALRLTARKTWRYFETFVTTDDNMLPPDNFQEAPEQALAHRTSPTNIGLYLLSAVAARDFAWMGLVETIERLEATFATLDKLPKYKGHFYNWYATQSLQTLLPAYVSSVDSGNLAGHLIALANACDEWREVPNNHRFSEGMNDNLSILSDALEQSSASHTDDGDILKATIAQIRAEIDGSQNIEIKAPIIYTHTDKAYKILALLSSADVEDMQFWLAATVSLVAEHLRDFQTDHDDVANVKVSQRLSKLAKVAREMANAMDFAFLMDANRKLMSIGYSQAENTLDTSCYDLLASEARLASLFAIAKGDVSTKHWFRLGRTATPLGLGSALISWSGSMFEYLMPSLVMRAPLGSLLEQTNRLVVARQKQYGDQLGIPWGISESGFNARDIEFTYQYSNFGVPGLGLKRGLSENRVIAPYATGLATMVSPLEAVQNYDRLKEMGAYGRYGFYEALDFTPSRLPLDQDHAIVHSYMSHHQGMTIVAILNCLQAGVMRSRFHREPCIQACELLLQERMPRDVAIGHPRAEEVKGSINVDISSINTVRKITIPSSQAPITHLLSNGHYGLMLTASGCGYSRWRDFAITRWHEDSTCDSSGSFILLKDVESGKIWSTTAQPFGCQGQFEPCVFAEDHAEFTMRHGNLNTTMEVLVSGEDDGEVRRVSVKNNGHFSHQIEFTTFAELVLAKPANDNAHPAFSKMFVQSEFVEEFDALIATRRKRSAVDNDIWSAHFAIAESDISAPVQYETSRANFIGRGNTLANASAMSMERGPSSQALTNTVGCVLDPIFSLRYRLKVKPGGLARISFWTVVASSRPELIDMIDRHKDLSAYDRAKTLAWTQEQVQLRHLGITSAEAADFQSLAAPILYNDPRFRAPSKAIIQGIRCQSELWAHSISGDLPIVLLRIDDIEDIEQLKQLLRAHEYWHMKGLAVDLVIINEHPTGYRQDLQNALETAVRKSQSRPRLNEEFVSELPTGAVYTFRADMLHGATREMLHAIARVLLVARHGSIGKQVLLRTEKSRNEAVSAAPIYNRKSALPYKNFPVQALPELEFFNGLGGFASNGREYVIRLQEGEQTPAPWINVIANPSFGFHVSAQGSGYTWSENSRENQLTSWSNDALSDPIGEIMYVYDKDDRQLYTASAQPLQDNGTYITRHGFGYSRFEHQVNGLSLDLLQYVPLADSIKISRLTLHNHSGRTRRLSVTGFTEWVLGTSRNAAGAFTTTALDPETKAILLRNRWGMAFPERVAFADMSGQQSTWTTDRTEFIGRRGCKSTPKALCEENALSGQTGAGYDLCTALQTDIELADGESVEVVMFIGQGNCEQHALELVKRYRKRDLNTIFDEVVQHWETLLTKVQVKTPDRAMDIMLNGWLLYQTIACRIWARSSFYQASGAYGFRDQLQDGMALTFTQPDMSRSHILRAAARQFVEGDVQHWWLPHSGQGVRTRISDDRAWLAFTTASYIKTSGDKAILNEIVPFLEGKQLAQDQHDAYFTPEAAPQSASLFEHCARALDQCIEMIGEHGLPLMGTGDWNDGMNLVGEQGKGESVWLGWLLIRAIDIFADYASEHVEAQAQEIMNAEKSDADAYVNNKNHEDTLKQQNADNRLRLQAWKKHAQQLRKDIDEHAWDGQWYRRATFDDGTWLGSNNSDECKIDSIAQSWAVLAKANDEVRVKQAMVSAEEYLICQQDKLALLFTPPFDKTAHNPGYIKGYPPGLRENGGQYSHASMWFMLALAKQGDGKKAVDLFAMLNPINHASNAANVNQYKVEPYAVAADIYSVEPYVGRGGWTWYTGAAGWMYQAGIEGILGFRREGEMLILQPCIPAEWPEFSATVKIRNSHFDISVDNAVPLNKNQLLAELNGVLLKDIGQDVRVKLEAGHHRLSIAAKETLNT
jgi:cyclic beta-1,2-glucan synthetase